MINLKFNLDPDNQDHMRALAAFAGALTGVEVTKEEPRIIVGDWDMTKPAINEPIKQVKKTRTAPKIASEMTEGIKQKEIPKKETEDAKKEPTEETGITVEDLRALTSEKAKGDHRPAIKAKLKELGAENVPQLKPEYYQEYFDYLNSLK